MQGGKYAFKERKNVSDLVGVGTMCVWVVGGVESSEAFFQGLGTMSSSSHQLKRMSLSHLPWNRSGAHTAEPHLHQLHLPKKK